MYYKNIATICCTIVFVGRAGSDTRACWRKEDKHHKK